MTIASPLHFFHGVNEATGKKYRNVISRRNNYDECCNNSTAKQQSKQRKSNCCDKPSTNLDKRSKFITSNGEPTFDRYIVGFVAKYGNDDTSAASSKPTNTADYVYCTATNNDQFGITTTNCVFAATVFTSAAAVPTSTVLLSPKPTFDLLKLPIANVCTAAIIPTKPNAWFGKSTDFPTTRQRGRENAGFQSK